MRSPEDCAKLILITMGAYNENKKNEADRIDNFLISRPTIKILSNRRHIKKAFLKKLSDELLILGWMFVDFDDDDERYAVLSIKKFYDYRRLTSRYTKSVVRNMKDSEEIDNVYSYFFDEEDDYEDDEAEDEDEDYE